jgi:hypothetical protein
LLQHAPVEHCAPSQTPPVQPYGQFEHHALDALKSQTWLVVQFATTVHVPGSSAPLHVALLPLHNRTTGRDRASAPQLPSTHPYSVQLSHCDPAGENIPPLQHGPVAHCCAPHDPPEQPYWQSLHHALDASNWHVCPVLHSVITVHSPYSVAPLQDVLAPLQYRFASRLCPSSPQLAPPFVHPYCVHVLQTWVGSRRYPVSEQHAGPGVHSG